MAAALPIRTRVEDAVVELLRDLEQKRILAAVRPYAGELGAQEPEDVMRVLNGKTPGVLVATTSGRFRGVDARRRRWRRELEVHLYLINNFPSSKEDRVRRAAAGIYALEDLALARLCGAKLELGDDVAAGHLEPVSEEVLVHTPDVCIWRQVWSITVEVDREDALEPDITEYLGKVNLPSEDDNAADPIVQVQNTVA